MNRSGKIIILVLAALVVLLVVMFAAAGSCSPRGGGAGGSIGDGNDAGTTSSVAASQHASADYDVTEEEFLNELETSTAPVGANARDAASSQGVLSAKEAYTEIESRGFKEFSFSANFQIDGTYIGLSQIDAGSNEKFPSYIASYESNSGVYWFIYCNDGELMAIPIGSGVNVLSKEVIFTESGTVIQYDGITNQYSDFSPSDIKDARVITVQRIDPATLDSYTLSQLGAL